MDSLIIIAIVILVGIPTSIIYLLISHSGLKRRVDELERQLRISPTDTPAPVTAEAPADETLETAAAAVESPWEKAIEEPPEPEPEPVTASPVQPQGPPRAVVMRGDRFSDLSKWMAQNWFYVVSAVSLALAGIFLVQYSIEQGLLPPWARVMAALMLGAALIAGGEYIRRRYGDDEDSSTAYLPSTFSSAGIVTLFGAVLAARTLYDLIGPEAALVGMALVGVVAMVLGWFYGPLLAAIGIIGAMAAPFVVGGSPDDPSWLLIYFALITVVGLAIDTVQRWAWVSVISLTLGFGAGFLLTAGAAATTAPYFIMFCAVLAIAAIAIPVRSLHPDHDGTPLSLSILAKRNGLPWPEFPTRLAGGALLAASALILFTAYETGRSDVFWTAIVILTGLILAILIWARKAPALDDLVVLPAAAFAATVAGGWRIWNIAARAAAEPETDMPLMATSLVGIGLLVSALAAWRSLLNGPAKVFFAAGAAIFAPAIAIAIETVWHPAATLGSYVWALHAMAIAALMVVTAERFARADGPDDRLRVSLAVLSALASVAFGMVILFSSAALTIALAVTVVAAAALDRQFNLPLMGTYILVGIATVGFRLVVDPGLGWAVRTTLPELLLSHGGAVLAFAAAWWLARDAKRPRSEVLLESAVFSTGGILLSLLLHRAILNWAGDFGTTGHWEFGIGATIWIALGLTQLRRLSLGGALRKLRMVLATIFLMIGIVQLLLVVSFFNPALDDFNNLVFGPPILNTLIPAYLLPAVILVIGARWLSDLPRPFLLGMKTISIALAALWLGLTIRHFWRGAEGMELPSVSQPELYSYTVALLVIGAALFYRSLSRRDPVLRKAGLFVIGLVVAKVFLIDISGLGGLIRVFSLLLLGLSLAGLAWLNRWAEGQGGGRDVDREA